jgi:hypothetical protein
MKKLLILLLIATGLSGCGQDYEDILDELQVEYCKVASMYSSDKDSKSAMDKIEVLFVDLQNELASLPDNERGPAAMQASQTMFAIQSEGISRCN